MNILHYTRKKHLETKMSAWSDDMYEQVPFDCDANLSDEDLRNRLSSAVYDRFPPRHYGGCGYSCSVSKVVRETPTNGYVVLMHYHGIGD